MQGTRKIRNRLLGVLLNDDTLTLDEGYRLMRPKMNGIHTKAFKGLHCKYSIPCG